MKAQKVIAAIFLALFACLCGTASAATSSPAPNVIVFGADEDTFTPPSNQGAANNNVIETIEVTPNTTGTLYQILNATTGQAIWETTSTETRPVTSTGVVVTAVGGINKIVDKVNILIPTGGIRFNTTTTPGAGFTGLYLYRRAGNQ